MKLQRWRLMFNNGAWCKSDDVAELESKCAELEAKCAELKAKHEQLRAASFELVFAVGLTPFSGDFPANQLTRICNEVLALVDPLKKQTKLEGRINEKQ